MRGFEQRIQVCTLFALKTLIGHHKVRGIQHDNIDPRLTESGRRWRSRLGREKVLDKIVISSHLAAYAAW